MIFLINFESFFFAAAKVALPYFIIIMVTLMNIFMSHPKHLENKNLRVLPLKLPTEHFFKYIMVIILNKYMQVILFEALIMVPALYIHTKCTYIQNVHVYTFLYMYILYIHTKCTCTKMYIHVLDKQLENKNSEEMFFVKWSKF